jgi:hypothetical protein
MFFRRPSRQRTGTPFLEILHTMDKRMHQTLGVEVRFRLDLLAARASPGLVVIAAATTTGAAVPVAAAEIDTDDVPGLVTTDGEDPPAVVVVTADVTAGKIVSAIAAITTVVTSIEIMIGTDDATSTTHQMKSMAIDRGDAVGLLRNGPGWPPWKILSPSFALPPLQLQPFTTPPQLPARCRNSSCARGNSSFSSKPPRP